MKINTANCPYPLGRAFVSILEGEIKKSGIATDKGVVINFHDLDYDAERGGFHPVEVRISADGTVQYITDLAFVGSDPHAELAKELDFDFSLGLFQHFGREFPIAQGRSLYRELWEPNFVSYHAMGVYSVLVDSD